MKANVPKEYEDTVYDFTYSKLIVDVLNKKIIRAEAEGKVEYANWLEAKLKIVLVEQGTMRKFMRDHGIKVTELEEVDDMFVQFNAYYANKAGGYKEGHNRIWRAALKLKLTRKLNELLQ